MNKVWILAFVVLCLLFAAGFVAIDRETTIRERIVLTHPDGFSATIKIVYSNNQSIPRFTPSFTKTWVVTRLSEPAYIAHHTGIKIQFMDLPRFDLRYPGFVRYDHVVFDQIEIGVKYHLSVLSEYVIIPARFWDGDNFRRFEWQEWKKSIQQEKK